MPLKPDSKEGLRRQIVQLETGVELQREHRIAAEERMDQLQSDLSITRYALESAKARELKLLRMVKELTEMAQ